MIEVARVQITDAGRRAASRAQIIEPGGER
jgi:hypothetical protein